MAPYVFTRARFNQFLQCIQILPEGGTPLAAAALVFLVTSEKQPGSICNIWKAIVIHMLHYRMMPVSCIRIKHANQAQIDPDDLVQFQHLFGQASVIEKPGAFVMIGRDSEYLHGRSSSLTPFYRNENSSTTDCLSKGNMTFIPQNKGTD